jgi:hypothetical protein
MMVLLRAGHISAADNVPCIIDPVSLSVISAKRAEVCERTLVPKKRMVRLVPS